jgi:hypothetical protein
MGCYDKLINFLIARRQDGKNRKKIGMRTVRQ